jgi:hypothetical protein
LQVKPGNADIRRSSCKKKAYATKLGTFDYIFCLKKAIDRFLGMGGQQTFSSLHIRLALMAGAGSTDTYMWWAENHHLQCVSEARQSHQARRQSLNVGTRIGRQFANSHPSCVSVQLKQGLGICVFLRAHSRRRKTSSTKQFGP